MMKLFASVSPAEWDKSKSAVNASYYADIFTLMTLFSRCEEKKCTYPSDLLCFYAKTIAPNVPECY